MASTIAVRTTAGARAFTVIPICICMILYSLKFLQDNFFVHFAKGFLL